MAGQGSQCPERLGPYELVRHIATGGMAEVYLARRDGPHGFSKTVALKRILPQLARDADFVAMFIDEARVCAQLSHPNLVQVFDFGEAGSELYMAMEYVDGTTCAKVVRRASARNSLVPIEAALHIVLSVLRGLEYAHAAVDLDGVPLGLVHRDVSPGNILIARSGSVKLGDFGIARADEFERRTEEGQLKGKLGYMSPEQVTGRPLDCRSDLFTLTIVLAEILTARPMFGIGSELDVLMRIRDADLSMFERYSGHVHDELRSIVRRGLSQRPDDRFPSAAAYAEAIEDYARQKRITVGAPKLVTWLELVALITGRLSGEHPMIDAARSSGQTPAPRDHTRRRSPLEQAAVQAASPKRRESPNPSPAVETARARLRESGADNFSPAVYRVAKDDKVTDPMTYARLVEMLATGIANANTLVSREQGPFRPARDLPELARLLVSPALAAPVEIQNQVKQNWPVTRATLPTQLFDLALRKETGLLVATQQQRRKQFFLVDGTPTFTTSTDKSELLGEQLVARGLAVPMEIEMALALCPRYGGRLGDALVGLGVLRPIELFRALVAQAQERYIELLSWRYGQLQFVPGVRAEGETILHGTSGLELTTRGVVARYPDDEIDDIVGAYLHQDVRSIPPVDSVVQQLRLPERESGVLLVIDRPMTIASIIDLCAETGLAGRCEVLRAVFIGLSARILITTSWPPATQRPSIPTMRMG